MKFMDWKKCEKEFVRKVDFDKDRFDSIIEMALDRLSLVKSLKVSDKNVSFIIENYYEVIKELLVAYFLKDCLKSKNHQCLISYFYKKNSDLENECLLISQMCFFRNRLNYYGDRVPFHFYREKKKEFERIIKIILEKLKDEK